MFSGLDCGFSRYPDKLINEIFICFRENFLEIDVFMSELYYEQVEQNVAYDLNNLWSKYI